MAPPSGTTKGNSVYKVPGGKLVKVGLVLEPVNGIEMIKEIRITGDFFIHPEDLIEELEEGLVGSNMDDIEMNIKNILAAHEKVQLVGIEGDDIIHAIELAGELAS
ncbi:MAG: hypothetical protein KAS67_04730 [Thermoplasmata archaeon]|nr:hypothetical protein [Thermoplasmata archaeon]